MKRKKPTGQLIFRRLGAALLAAATLAVSFRTAGCRSMREAADALNDSLVARTLLRWELGDFSSASELSFQTALAFGASPLLRLSEEAVLPLLRGNESDNADDPLTEEVPEAVSEPAPAPKPVFADNGVPARTLTPASDKGYLLCGSTHISTSTSYSAADIAYDGSFAAHLTDSSEPQVLIFHTHGSEAYTPPPGEDYESSGDHRTRDASASVIRVGDEMAEALSAHGISVLHDRELYDDPAYNGAYNRSLAAVEGYLAKYPGIRLVIDVHRDAVSDASGNMYKVVADEGANSPAQMTLVMGSDAGGLYYPAWRDNLHLAIALQEYISQEHPTLMRPMLLRKSRYNQHVSTGALLVEVGAAGNSLAEACAAARIFADALAAVAAP